MLQGLLTGVLFLDLKKAFDTVDHKILSNKLQMYGIGVGELDWFKDYLSNRVQCTKVNNTLSSFFVSNMWYAPRFHHGATNVYIIHH